MGETVRGDHLRARGIKTPSRTRTISEPQGRTQSELPKVTQELVGTLLCSSCLSKVP